MLFVLASITSNIVGSIFLLTGIAKVIEPWKFGIRSVNWGKKRKSTGSVV